MEKNKLGQLSDWILKQKNGKELIAELRRVFTDSPAIPQSKELLENFGGANNYMAYRQGQLSVLKHIELHAKGYRDQQVALQKKTDKERK